MEVTFIRQREEQDENSILIGLEFQSMLPENVEAAVYGKI